MMGPIRVRRWRCPLCGEWVDAGQPVLFEEAVLRHQATCKAKEVKK